jgi:hypothetical protein
MKIYEKLNRLNKNIWFLLIFAVSVFLYLFNITFSDIWIDETFTKALVEHSFRDMMGLIKNDFHPPLYFYALKVFVTVFGGSTFTIRLFSVLGVLSSLVLGYVAGQRVFGKSGALYFCLLILSLPMLAAYSHDARMYTWGAFTVTGVFLYSVLFISTNRKSDLVFLMLFSLMAAYTHYYGLIAAFGANIFVGVLLFARKNRSWRIHLGFSFLAVLFYLPWLFVLLNHTKKAQEFFWVPAVTWQTILSCFIFPFAQKFRMSLYSWPMVFIVYSLTLWVIYRNYIARKDQQGVVLGLSLFIFGFTVITTAVISLFSQPVLYHRYIMNIVIMLLVPPALFFTAAKNNWVKGIFLTVILSCGIVISIRSSYFSYGPYKQSVEYIHKTYPEIKKIFHVIEISAGPFVEYSNPDIENYWFKPEKTIVFTNMDVFSNLHTTDSLGKVLKKDEPFCAVSFDKLTFNKNNLKQIISESRLLKVDTVMDNKAEPGSKIVLYILKYQGTKSGMDSDLLVNDK